MELQKEIGYIVKNQDYLLYIEGLSSIRINDLIRGPSGAAIVSGLEGNHIQALMLGSGKPKPGEIFERAPGLRIPLVSRLLSRTINPLGLPLDGKSAIPFGETVLDLETKATGINSREILSQQLYTGFTLVDTLLPIGKGERELIFGDARSGKSSFILDVIANQKDRGLICIYTAVGKSEIEVKRSATQIESSGAAPYTVIVAGTSSEPAPIIALAPSVAFAIAEEYRKGGQDVLLIIDDLGLHAKYLREIALLSQQIPGRESYPGNIFYEHSRLMERAGKFKKEYGGGGTITLLPVIETDLDNFTALIPTNLMSQTDGHLLFSASLAALGQYPSIGIARSVTRVGRQVQLTIQKLMSTKIRTLLANYQDLKTFSKFETELSEETQRMIKEAEIVTEFLKQEPTQNLSIKTQLTLLGLAFTSIFREKGVEFAKTNKQRVIQIIEDNLKDLEVTQFDNLDQFQLLLEKQAVTIESLCH